MIASLPRDFIDFIASGRPLEYDSAECDVGKVTLASLDQLRLSLFSMDCDETEFGDEDPNQGHSGSYLVEGVDLIQDSDGGYGAEGLLIWLPLDHRYAAWDNSHNKIFVFEEKTTWTDIVKSPIRFLNAQWEAGDVAPVSLLKPWINHVYNRQQVFGQFAYPALWFHAEQTLRGKFVDGVQTRVPRCARVEWEATEEAFLLNATLSHMDKNHNWVIDQNSSRSINAIERAKLREMIQTHFWNAGDLETDLGESVIYWSMEGFEDKRYRSISQFYSDHPKHDCIAELGQWILKLAGIPPLESFLA